MEQGKKVYDCTDSEISKCLTKVYFLIGLRPQHYPSELMDSILFKYLRDSYGNKTIDEVYHAFELAIFGRLDLEDVKVYDMFSVEYLVRIMEGYRKYKNKLIINTQVQKIDKQLPMGQATPEEMNQELNEWREKQVQVHLIPLYLYDYMIKLNYTNKDLPADILWKACMIRKNDLHKRAGNGEKDAINDHHAFADMIEVGEITGAEKMIVGNIAKKIIVFEYLKK
tara:strand:+ start:224 stop:898 length:675 start_codon:yes stop_codon:yes gene_type:complete